MAHDVFISYSSHDKRFADAICATLEASKIRCWIAPRDVLPGMPYGQALSEALQASRVLVLVFSSSSNQSAHVMREVENAVGNGIPIVPFRIEDVQPSRSLDFFVRSIHWLDAVTPPLEKHLQTLADTVRLMLRGQFTTKVTPASGIVPAATESVTSTANPAIEVPQVRVRAPWLTTVKLLCALALALGVGWFAWRTFTKSTLPSASTPAVVPSPPTARGTVDPGLRHKPDKPLKTRKQQTRLEQEAAVRALIERFYSLLVKKDEDGLIALFSQKLDPTELESTRNALKTIITDTGKINVKQLVIDHLEVEEDVAKARVTVLMAATTVLTGQAYFPSTPVVQEWDLVEDDDGWRLLQSKAAKN